MLDFIKRIGIFIICAQCMMHFTAGKDYEKYVKLLIGLMILGQFVVPLRAVFIGTEQAEIWDQIETFQQEIESTAESNKITYDLDDDITTQVMEEIKSKLNNSAETYGYQIDSAHVDGDQGEEKLILVLSDGGGKASGIHIENIKPSEGIRIGEEKEMNLQENPKFQTMKKDFAARLGVEVQYLEIREK